MSATMLYRAAAKPNPEVWNLKVEHQPFADEDVSAALDQGWALHPFDVAQPADANAANKPLEPGTRAFHRAALVEAFGAYLDGLSDEAMAEQFATIGNEHSGGDHGHAPTRARRARHAKAAPEAPAGEH